MEKKLTQEEINALLAEIETDDELIRKDTIFQKLSDIHKGRPAANKGVPMSIEARKKLSETNKGKTGTMLGKTMSNETKEKMSKTRKGRVAPNKGVPHTEEHKENIRKAKENSVLSEESRRKIGDGKRGIATPDEVRQKISAANTGLKRTNEMKMARTPYVYHSPIGSFGLLSLMVDAYKGEYNLIQLKYLTSTGNKGFSRTLKSV